MVVFGVRHHSPACTRALLEALVELRPAAVAVEFPADLAEHLPWLGNDGVKAPVAVAAAVDTADTIGRGMSLYPFADFSPELAVIRWAVAHDVPVHAVDLPVGAKVDGDETTGNSGGNAADVSDMISQDAWDARVETMSTGAPWRAVRRAALAVGYAARASELSGGPRDPRTSAREGHMRQRVEELVTRHSSDGPVFVVVGSFHAASLMGEFDSSGSMTELGEFKVSPVTSSLVPYSFAQLDSRSGYPSGIRDPRWRQLVLGVPSPEPLGPVVTGVITDVARALRSSGHPAGPAEIGEAVRVANGLAAIRDLPAPGRGEVLEALTTVLAQGSVAGHGRAVATALQQVMVGDRTGELPSDAPEPALLAAVRAHVAELGMPTQERSAAKDVRVEPFGGRTGLARHVLLQRLDVLSVPYLLDSTAGTTRGLGNRSYTATVSWRAHTTAALNLLGSSGVSLEQVTEMVLLGRISAAEGVHAVLEAVADAARTGADNALCRALDALEPLEGSLGFSAAVHATELLGPVSGSLPAAALLSADTRDRCAATAAQLAGAVVREVQGVAGSDDLADARLLGRTASLVEAHTTELTAALHRLVDHGSPLMSGAAVAVLDRVAEPRCGTDLEPRIGSWLDLGARAATRKILERRLAGYLAGSSHTWTTSGAVDGLVDRLNAAPDDLFVSALPALRGAFDTVSPAEREDFLDHLAAMLGDRPDGDLDVPAETMTGFATIDSEARHRLAALGLADVHFAPATRWRLILGADPEELPPTASRMASTLDELYGDPGADPTGATSGRVRAGRRGNGGRGGDRRISVRTWSGDIEALFGADQVQEILATAAEKGRADALLGPDGTGTLDPGSVRPSVELLSTVLGLRGALSESQLGMLRPLVARLVNELTKELASRITPVLAGLAGSRPTTRRTGRLDLPATIRRNLRHVTEIDGRCLVVPETPVFLSPVHKTSPWHIIVVVDVSPSMETSTVYAAVTAAILSGIATYRISVLTFDSEVMDLSGLADDPLSLLLEVSPGGGTDIAKAVAVAADKVTDPTRTAMVVISDFEEGGSVPMLISRVRDLVESGVRMLGCAALTDGDTSSGGADSVTGVSYNVGVTRQLAAVGMRVAPVSPVQLARWVGEVLR
ncbi:MAG TPA: VWA domain-containing protein [Candidatus Corynebacterium avicola]|uniref:VWA domain-containing protein n=1 Tax=Candidatus Corynebacterium avicola TaxID=2838527 RepID=A0A9D1ULU5_9CORY|nr:VWA domain-containing protein [Candidatus Corynebacterium avicola]